MAFSSDSSTSVAADLLDWPPLRVFVSKAGTLYLPVADLVYLKSELSYSWLQWTDGRQLLVPYPLKHIQEKLPPAWFVRLHRHCIVNRRFIERIEIAENGAHVYLSTGLSFPVSRRRWARLRKELDY